MKVDVERPLVMNDIALLRDAASAGMGLAFLPEAAVEPQIANGAFVRVLEDLCKPFPGSYLYHPSGHRPPSALITFLQAETAQ